MCVCVCNIMLCTVIPKTKLVFVDCIFKVVFKRCTDITLFVNRYNLVWNLCVWMCLFVGGDSTNEFGYEKTGHRMINSRISSAVLGNLS